MIAHGGSNIAILLRIVVKNSMRELPLGAIPCFQNISPSKFLKRITQLGCETRIFFWR